MSIETTLSIGRSLPQICLGSARLTAERSSKRNPSGPLRAQISGVCASADLGLIVAAGEVVAQINCARELVPEARFLRFDFNDTRCGGADFMVVTANLEICVRGIVGRDLLDDPGEMITILEDHLIAGSALNRRYLVPIDSEGTGNIFRFDIQNSLLELLYLSGNSISVLHHYNVAPLGIRGKTREKQQQQQRRKANRGPGSVLRHLGAPGVRRKW